MDYNKNIKGGGYSIKGLLDIHDKYLEEFFLPLGLVVVKKEWYSDDKPNKIKYEEEIISDELYDNLIKKVNKNPRSH